MGHTATISSKGQVVIPAELRKKFNLRPSTKIVFGVENGKLTLEPTAFDQVMALKGCLAELCGKYAGSRLAEHLAEERRRWEDRLEEL